MPSTAIACKVSVLQSSLPEIFARAPMNRFATASNRTQQGTIATSLVLSTALAAVTTPLLLSALRAAGP
jgi:hypothetical protein